MKKKQIKLTHVPSDLIRLALKDLRKVERDKKTYRVNMDQWHMPNSHCSVCFAGAVMAQTMKCDPDDEVNPYHDTFSGSNDRAFFALDYLRRGHIGPALDALDKERPNGVPYEVPITPYTPRRKEAFHKDMRKLATMLKRAGL